MKISLERVNDKVHFQAVNADGNRLDIDGGPGVGGEGKGFRPMETVLAGLAGCSVMDLVHIITKQKMDLRDVKLDVQARRADAIPSPFTHISLHFKLYGVDLDEKKCARAVTLAVEKYCSAGVMLGKTAEIVHSHEIISL